MNTCLAAAWLLCATIPDWALLMQGEWKGSGRRVEAPSNRVTLVETAVSSRWVEGEGGGALVSSNHIREVLLGADGNPVRSKEYDRVYWIQEVARTGQAAQLAFGSGSQPGLLPGSTGTFEAGQSRMTSVQVVGGSMRVELVTDLSRPGEARTLERVSFGQSLHSEADLFFNRSKN